MLCPCKSQKDYANCCQQYIEYKTHPSNAEQLMRSRYSAYSVNAAEYIFRTYASIQRQDHSIEDINQWSVENKWVNLIIHQSILENKEPTVEFSAFYVHKNKLYEMREISTFIEEDNQWYYYDGDIVKHEQLSNIKRNDLCPCQSEKKYKKCCG